MATTDAPTECARMSRPPDFEPPYNGRTISPLWRSYIIHCRSFTTHVKAQVVLERLPAAPGQHRVASSLDAQATDDHALHVA
jgi:hypothetical protein